MAPKGGGGVGGAVKILRLLLGVKVEVPVVAFGGVGGVLRVAFKRVTFGIGLLRAHLTDLLFVLALVLVLVLVIVSLLVLVFVVVLRSVCRPC